MKTGKPSSPAETIQELTSLARLIQFAKQTAKDLEADFPRYLLELAHGAVLEEIYALDGDAPDFVRLVERPALEIRASS
jgi:hypothetical protein